MHFLVKHVRDENDEKQCTLYAQADNDNDNEYQVGWAVCAKGDVFSKKEGVTIARARAQKYRFRKPTRKASEKEHSAPPRKLPDFMLRELPTFLNRCDRYFKDKAQPEWCGEALAESDLTE